MAIICLWKQADVQSVPDICLFIYCETSQNSSFVKLFVFRESKKLLRHIGLEHRGATRPTAW
jgi:hypothetical protein